MAANLYVSIGADYSQLLTDLNQATSKTMNFFKQASKDTVLRLHAKLDSDALNTVYSQLTDQLKKFNVSSSKNIFSVFDDSTKQNMLKFLDFSKPAQSMQEVIERANKLNRVLIDLNSGIGYIDANSKDAIDTYLAGLNQIIAASKTYEQVARKSFLNTFAANKKGIIASYGDDEASLKRKRALWEQLRNEFIKYETQSGISQSKNIASIESEIDATKRLLDAKTGLNKFNKEYKNLVNQLYGAKQNGDIEKQVQLYRQLRNINLKYYGDTKDTRFRDNAQIYQQQLDALQQKTNLQKQDEANNKKILELEKQRDEINRRLGMIPANSKKKQDLLEQIQLYRNLASVEQKLYNRTYDIQHRNNADAFRAQARALAELNKQYVSSETIQRKLAGIKNLQGGIVANTMDPAQLDTNRRLLQRIISLQNDLQQAGRPQNIKQSMADLEMYKQKLREIRRENLGTNTSFMRQGGILQSLVSYARMYLSIWQGIRLVKSIAETTGEFEKQKAALKSIIQDGAIAVELFNKLKQYSLQTPLTFQELVSTTKKLTAYQIPVEDLFETTKRLSDLSSGLGVDINRIVLAYGQIRAASVLRGQEVRQLTEAGIPIINELANAFSNLEGRAVSTAEVFKKISERGVSFQMVKDILFDMTREGGKFYNMQEKLMQTDIYGPMQKMKDLWKQTLDEIGRSSKDGILKKGLDAILTTIKNWRVVLGSVAGLIAGKLTAGVINLVKWVMTLNRAMVIANLSNIITAAATAIGLLIGKMIEANSKMKNFMNSINEVNFEYNKKASELIESFKKLYEELNNTTQGSKAEEEALRKLQNAFSEYLPQQDLSIKRLRDQTKGYEDLTEAILHNVEAQRRVAIEQSAKNEMDNTIKSKLSKLKYQNTYNQNMPYGQQDLKPKLIPDNKDIFKNWFISYISTNIGKLDTETIKNNVLESYKSMYEKMFPDGTDYNDIAKSLSLYVNEIEAIYKQYSGFLNESNDFYKIADSNGQYSQEIEDKVTEISNQLKEALINNNYTKIDKQNGQTIEMLNNASYFKYYNDMLNAIGLKTDSDGMYDKFKTGDLKSYNIVSFIRRAMYKNGIDDKGGITEGLQGINTYYRNRISKIEKEATDRFPFLGNMKESINDFIKSNTEKKLNTLLFDQETSYSDWSEKLTQAFNNIQNEIGKFDTNNINEQTKKYLEELESRKKLLIELGKLGSVRLETKEGNKDITEKQKIAIDEQKTELQKLRTAFNAYNNMIKYVSQESAKTTLNDIFNRMFDGEGNPNKKEYWQQTFNNIYNKVLEIDKSAAESLKNDFENMFPVDEAKYDMSKIKKEVEDIDRIFSRSSNAREYFKELIDAGVAWKDAIKYAQEIDSTFSIGKEMSSLMADKVMNYVRFAGIEVPDDKLDSIESIDDMEKYVRNNLSEQTEIFNPLISALEALRRQIQLENVSRNKYSYENYSPFGICGKAAPDITTSFAKYSSAKSTEGISGAIEQLNKLYALSEKNTLIYGSKTGIGIEAIKVALQDCNTDLANKIADTMPFGDMLKKGINSKSFDKSESLYGLIVGIGEYSDNLSNVAEGLISVVEEIDSVIEAFGGKVDKNDALHTMLNAFSGISSSISGVFTSALKLDIGGVLSNLVGIITKPIKAIIYAGDNRLQEAIENLNKDIEAIDNAINNLKREAELLYGDAAWEKTAQVYSKMQTKLVKLNNKVNLEKSKKNPDDDAVTEYENAVTDMQLQMKEFNRSIRDELIGTVDDWSSRLGNALRNAFDNGKNAARSWKETVDSLINDMIYNMIITQSLQPVIDGIMENVMNKAKESYSGKTETDAYKQMKQYYQGLFGVSDEAFEKAWKSTGLDKYETDPKALIEYFTDKSNVDELKQALGSAYEPIMKILENANLINTSSSSASSNSLQSMTEDTAKRLEALWNTNLSYVLNINFKVAEIYSNTMGIRAHIEKWKSDSDMYMKAVKNNQSAMLSYFNEWSNGNKKIYVIQN